MVIRYNPTSSFKKLPYINPRNVVEVTSLLKTFKQLTPGNFKYLLSITPYLKPLGYRVNKDWASKEN